MMKQDRSPGWDKAAVNGIAKKDYGSLQQMFEAHGWAKDGRTYGQIAPTRVVSVYGSVEAFVSAHENGVSGNSLQHPYAAIEAKMPNVWLTSFYGFDPEDWGSLGFSTEQRRQEFIDATHAGVLVVVYNSLQGDPHWRRVVGILQCSHEKGYSKDFISPAAWQTKRENSKSRDKWNYAVKVKRAWRVAPEAMPLVTDFAPEATRSGAWQHIGARGVGLTRAEVRKIGDLLLQEVNVYGEANIVGSVAVSGKDALKTSKAGPVSKNSFVVTESEGPKHLYILTLRGDVDALLGKSAKGRLIVKAGFSKSPELRCDAFNKALPACAFRWEVSHTSVSLNSAPYPCSEHAKIGEKLMHELLCKPDCGESLGGEFFLAEPKQVEKAWLKGNQAARDADK